MGFLFSDWTFVSIGLTVFLQLLCVVASSSSFEEGAALNASDSSASREMPELDAEISAGLAVYRKVLRSKRVEQQKSILMLHEISDLKKQAKLATPAIKKILEILSHQRTQVRLNDTDFESLSLTEKEVVSTILENVLFLGDFVLRLPDTTGKLLKKTPGSSEIVHWAVAYASSLNYLDQSDLRILDLMAQELQLIPRREGYLNIYTEAYKKQQEEAQKQAAKEAAKNKKPDKKKKKKPLMSGQFGDEL
ncbi:hypothetical protein BV898_04047 [Hypsibius exemplaris]|uniref:Coiled-coil domain-containing protein 134 n=1 Tax=Hypsibius exemplaris TaxID=2072580 RepID=A0A1W0X442_HYPEX|nr:hypothetical protein BV898_04047 [Hypsibius exemplaris]